jgi:hypothetical protein
VIIEVPMVSDRANSKVMVDKFYFLSPETLPKLEIGLKGLVGY